MEYRIILYFKLFAITIVSVFLCMLIAVAITRSRESGMGIGFYTGLAAGDLFTSLLSKYSWKFTVVQFVFYCIFLSGMFYTWFDVVNENEVLMVTGMFVLMLASAELANQLTMRITPMQGKKTG